MIPAVFEMMNLLMIVEIVVSGEVGARVGRRAGGMLVLGQTLPVRMVMTVLG